MVCSRYPKEYRYYEFILKKKCFRKLKINVWEKKSKDKLMKKADLYLKRTILRKYFDYWIVFLNQVLVKKINQRLAKTFHEEKIKIKVLDAFMRNVENNKIIYDILKSKSDFNLKNKIWHRWKHYVMKRVRVNKVKGLASKIREEKLFINIIKIWYFRLQEKNKSQVFYFKN